MSGITAVASHPTFVVEWAEPESVTDESSTDVAGVDELAAAVERATARAGHGRVIRTVAEMRQLELEAEELREAWMRGEPTS